MSILDWRTKHAETAETFERLEKLAIGLGVHKRESLCFHGWTPPSLDMSIWNGQGKRTGLDWFRENVALFAHGLGLPPTKITTEHLFGEENARGAPDLFALWDLWIDESGAVVPWSSGGTDRTDWTRIEVRVRCFHPTGCKIKPGTERPEGWSPPSSHDHRAPVLHSECEHALAELESSLESAIPDTKGGSS